MHGSSAATISAKSPVAAWKVAWARSTSRPSVPASGARAAASANRRT
jgi:hypothetical protein